MTVRRAVIPAAGWGTRFLPATKAVPKEMLPVVDRPVIEYAVAEAVGAGITEVVVVVSEGKQAIGSHFSPHPALEAALEAAGKDALLAEVQRTSALASMEYVIQEEQLGLGHAVATAAEAVGDEPFAVLLPDEVITSGLLETMLEVFTDHDAPVIGLMEVPRAQVSAYGVPSAEPVEPGLVRVRSIVEKPDPADAPSSYATIGRYVFSPEILEALERVEPGVGGEIQLTDAIDMVAQKQPVYGSVLESGRWDVGKVLGLMRASLELALERDDLRDDVKTMIIEIARDRGLS